MRTLEDISKVKKINSQIDERHGYGFYLAEIPKTEKFVVLYFSNAYGGRWYIDHPSTHYLCGLRKMKIEEAVIDSNKIVVKGTKKEIRPLLIKLKNHPMYNNSFEARKR